MDLALGKLKNNIIDGLKFIREEQFRTNIINGFKFVLSDKYRVLITLVLSIIGFVSFLLMSAPIYAYELIMGGYIVFLFEEMIWVLQDSAGLFGVVLTGIYSLAFGVVIYLTYKQVRVYNRGLKNTLAVIPGVLMTGCVGCGTGILGLIGVVGFNFILPFGGNSIRLIGIIIFLLIMGYIGDPYDHTQQMSV